MNETEKTKLLELIEKRTYEANEWGIDAEERLMRGSVAHGISQALDVLGVPVEEVRAAIEDGKTRAEKDIADRPDPLTAFLRVLVALGEDATWTLLNQE